MDEMSMFKDHESELLKSAAVRQYSQSWNGARENLLNEFDLYYKLPAVGAPDWGAIFEDWVDMGAIFSGQNFFVS